MAISPVEYADMVRALVLPKLTEEEREVVMATPLSTVRRRDEIWSGETNRLGFGPDFTIDLNLERLYSPRHIAFTIIHEIGHVVCEMRRLPGMFDLTRRDQSGHDEQWQSVVCRMGMKVGRFSPLAEPLKDEIYNPELLEALNALPEPEPWQRKSWQDKFPFAR